MYLRACKLALLFVSWSLAGCGSDDNAAPPADGGNLDVTFPDVVAVDAGSGDAHPDGPYPAPHAALPQVLNNGGPVLKSPKIVAITFAKDPDLPVVSALTTSLQKTPWWTSVMSQYGVGPIASATIYTLDQTAPSTIDDSQIQPWLASMFSTSTDAGAGADAEAGADAGAGAGVQIPAPDPNTVYLIVYPAATTVTTAFGTSCRAFGGYHDDFLYNGSYVTYAVVAVCPSSLSQQDQVSQVSTHELAEAASDPQPTLTPGWLGTNPEGVAWQYVGEGGEIGDMCEQFTDSFYTPAGFYYAVQHIWSNSAALAGHDPCQPDGKYPYFNAAPVLPDTLSVSLPNAFQVSTSPGVKIAVGQSRTIELDLFSEGPMDPWNVAAQDVGAALFGQSFLSFSFDTISGQNGDKIHLTITVLKEGPGGAEPFWIVNNSQTETTYWPAVVGQ